MTLINKELLLEKVSKFAPDSYGIVANVVNRMPTIEPKRGRWVFDNQYGEYQCSECTRKATYYERYNEDGSCDLILPNYCGYCGARMDKGETEE